MSASLVGSEMCIRDRLPAVVWRVAIRRRLMPLQAGRERQPQAGPQGRQSVSYTHLTLPTICSV
eukprot:4118239-Alexandrium_andersonii.AAC.1